MSDPTKRQWGKRNWLFLLFVLLWSTLMLWNVYREVRAYESRQMIRNFLDKPDNELLVAVSHSAESTDSEVLKAEHRLANVAPHSS